MKPALCALVLHALLAAACGGAELDPTADAPRGTTAAAPLTTCVVERAPADTVAIRAVPGGLLIGHGGVLTRARGAGCALALEPRAFAMEAAGLDADDAGHAYVMPASSSDPAVVSTTVDNAGVVRIDDAGNVEGLVSRGRWIAGFSIAPAGDELTVYGCAATGLHRQSSDGWVWDREASTRAEQVGFVGPSAVAAGGGAIVMMADETLMRVTASGSTELGSAALALAPDTEPRAPTAISRCGRDRLCALYAGGVALLDAQGAVLRTVGRNDVPMIADDEQLAGATGDEHGLYVLLQGGAGARVVFVP